MRELVPLAAPQDVILMARSLMSGIDFDPYTIPYNNRLALAAKIFDHGKMSVEDIVNDPWDVPGAKRVFAGLPYGAGLCRRVMNKILREYRQGRVRQAVIWLGHNETMLKTPWMWDFPVCVPFRRLRPCYWDEERGEFINVTPADWSCVIYLPPPEPALEFHQAMSRFHVCFGSLGRIVFNEFSGEDDWLLSYAGAMRKNYNLYA